MPRILAIDYGRKRTGLAVTDPLKIIAGGLATVSTSELIGWLGIYIAREPVELFVIGEPKNLDGSETDATQAVAAFIRLLNRHFPGIPVKKMDERFTSKLASRSMVESGLKKKDRRNKALVDEISATIILQDYLKTI